MIIHIGTLLIFNIVFLPEQGESFALVSISDLFMPILFSLPVVKIDQIVGLLCLVYTSQVNVIFEPVLELQHVLIVLVYIPDWLFEFDQFSYDILATF